MTEKIKLGLKENWLQFTILVIVNAFVGGMVGSFVDSVCFKKSCWFGW